MAAASTSSSSCFVALDQNLSQYTSDAKLLCNGSTSHVYGYIEWSSHEGCWEQFHDVRHPGKHCTSKYLITLSGVTITHTSEPAWGRQYWKDDRTARYGFGVRFGLDCSSWPPADGITFVDMYKHRVATEFGPKADKCDVIVREHLCALTPMDLWNVRLACSKLEHQALGLF